MVREIAFSVGLDSISPGNRQIVGMQRESNATTVKFIVEEAVRSKMDIGNLKYRFEAIDSLGSVDFGELKGFMWEEGSETRRTFEYVIPEPLTRNGGNGEVYLIIACFDESGDCLYEWRSRPAKLTFVGVENDGGAMDKERESLSALASQATAAAKTSEKLRADIEKGIADGTFRGVSGVHVGTEPPEDDDVNVWVDPSGDDTLLSVTVEETENGHIVKIKDANGEHSFKVLNGKDGIQSDSDIPDYWKESLKEGAEDINTALCEAGQNKSAFLFYTDAHWFNGTVYTPRMEPALLRYLYRNTPINKIIFGGDIVLAETTERSTMKYLREWQRSLRGLNHHSVVGNHDDGNTTNNLFSEKYVYSYLQAPEENPQIVREDTGLFYYIDEPVERTRYLYLDTAYKPTENIQAQFIINALLSTPENWHIVAIAHIWFANDYTQSPPVITGFDENASKIVALFDAYNSRATGNLDLSAANYSYDFSDCGGFVEFCIGGHSHIDHYEKSTGGIPVFVTESSNVNDRSGLPHNTGTVSETAITAIVADYDAFKINIIRIGRGSGTHETGDSSENLPRELSLRTRTTYTNLLRTAIDADGSIYNSSGYRENTRITTDSDTGLSNGVEEYTGTDVTGFIPYVRGDTVYLANMTFYSTAYDNIAVYFYPSLSLEGGYRRYCVNLVNSVGTTDAGSFKPVLDDENIVQFTIPTAGYEALPANGYFRICANNINDYSVVTVNELINVVPDVPETDDDTTGDDETGTTSYTNVLPLAVDTDGTVYNGSGFKQNMRWSNSSNNFKDAGGDNWDVTGYIAVKQGDILRLKNITWQDGSYSRMNIYNADFEKFSEAVYSSLTSNASYGAVTDGNGNITQFTIPDWSDFAAIAYIRINCQDLDGTSVITINEPIE